MPYGGAEEGRAVRAGPVAAKRIPLLVELYAALGDRVTVSPQVLFGPNGIVLPAVLLIVERCRDREEDEESHASDQVPPVE